MSKDLLSDRQKVRAGSDLSPPNTPSKFPGVSSHQRRWSGRDSFICSPICTNLKSLIQLSVTVQRTVVISVRSHPLSTNKWLVFLTGANHTVSGWPRAGTSVGGGLRLHPLEPGWQPFSRESTAALDMPRVVFDGTEREKLGDLCCGHGVFDILLVGKDQY